MARSLDFVALGDQCIEGVPLRCLPLAEKNALALYRRRLEALETCEADYLCFVDGNEDVCLPGFVEAMQALADAEQPLGYASELVWAKEVAKPAFTLSGFLRDFTLIHHGVVCNVERLRKIKWPSGVYSWEVIAYGTLAQQGFVFDPIPRYDYRPSPGGARLWPSYSHGIINSLRFLQGL